MAINFPNAPNLYEVYNDTVSKNSYIWNGQYWAGYTSTTSYKVSLNLASIVVEDDSSPVGIVSTLDFADNLGVQFSAGVATVTGAGGIATGFSPTASINTTGIITAASFGGSGANLTGLTAATAGIYGDASFVPQISVDSTGRIVGISTIAISGSGGASLLNDLTDVVINGGTLTSGQVLKYDGLNWVNGVDLAGSESYWGTSVSGIHTLTSVGIGTTNPTSTLTVVGNISASGIITTTNDIYAAGDIYVAGVAVTSFSQANIAISTTAPVNPSSGKLWYSSQYGRAFVYYNDGTSSQWVDLSPSIPGPAGATTQWITTAVGIHTLSNVGIGTTNPSSSLDVLGNSRFVGDLNINGTVLISGGVNSPFYVNESNDENTNHNIVFATGSGNNYRSLEVDDGEFTFNPNTNTLNVANVNATNYSGSGSNLTGIVTSITAGTGISINQSSGNVTINSAVGTVLPTAGIGTFNAVAEVATEIDSFTISTTDYKALEYTLHVGFGTYIQAQKILLMQNGSNAFVQEYAIMGEPDIIVGVAATVSGGVCRLQLVPEVGVTGSVTYRYNRTGLL